ncbi:sigma-54 interaction domain-containing protein [Parerythrobacter aestuarii]|uniref:sigma-54 interaction domain-containing protein n=1 Tax=Parerythrobacter aestuarii TaxID=3020909 RepID=UPI0024DEE190|nr:sigma 54-interacting transcriptional regulator [Parerythrobacter aestuarii]
MGTRDTPDIVIIDDDALHARHLCRLAQAHHLQASRIDPRSYAVGEAPPAQLALIKSDRDAELVRDLTAQQPDMTTIVLGDSERADHIIACMRAGASDVVPADLSHPESLDRLHTHFGRCKPSSTSEGFEDPVGLAGESNAIDRLRQLVRKIGHSDTTCLIEGPTGAGKELVALGLHNCGARCGGPLVAVNCGAIPDDLVEGELFGYEKGAFSGAVNSYPGKLALAHGGTLFLDEIGELSLAGQVKLLRAIEARQCYRLGGREPLAFDVRIVAATNRDLESEVAAGRFRSDLYYRIAVARIKVPALAERRDDIAPLAEFFLREMAAASKLEAPTLSPCAIDALQGHSWPGNARELRNVIEVALISHEGGMLYAEDLSLPGNSPSVPQQSQVETAANGQGLTRSAIAEALRECDGNKSAAARTLGCSRMTLYRHLQQA